MSDYQELRQTEDGIMAYGLTVAEAPTIDLRLVKRRFRSRVLGDDSFAKAVFLCAETGLGKTHLSKDLLDDLASEGIYTRYVSLKGSHDDRATRKVMRVAREVCKATEHPRERKAVVLDDMPSVDECYLGRLSRAIGRMIASNTLVIVCMLPEAEMLAEEVVSAKRLNSQDLTSIYLPEVIGLSEVRFAPSAGIAALLFHDAPSAITGAAAGVRWDSYVKTLSSVARAHVRPSLPAEEQRLRLAMILLGTGSTEILSSVIPRLDSDSVEWTRRDAPLFGIDRIMGTFCCVGLSENSVFEPCLPELEDVCAKYPDTAARAARALAANGNYVRAALVCSLCAAEDIVAVGMTWGVEFVCAGCSETVRKALELRDLGYGGDVEGQELSALALAYASEPFSSFDERPLPEVSGPDVVSSARRLRLVELLRMSRDLDRGVRPRRPPRQKESDGDMERALIAHVRARSLLLSGEFSDAYALLVNNPARISVDSLASALLCDDFALAQLLTGEGPNQEERLACLRARQIMRKSGIKRLVGYRDLLEPLAMVLCGRSQRLDGVEAAISRASRMGDDAVRAVLLLVSAVVDNRAGAFARAHVRAVQAAELLGGTANVYLARAAHFVDVLASYGLGDEEPLELVANAGSSSLFKDLAALFICTGPGDEVELTTLVRSACSRNVLWVLNVLGNDFEGRSRAFRQAIPPTWSTLSRKSVRKALSMARESERFGFLPEPRLVSEHAGPEGEGPSVMPWLDAGSRAISIRLLGSFEMRVNGEVVGAKSFGKRRARAFMTHLACRKNHSLTRRELLESIWPESDYDSGRQKIYEATSVVRNALKGKEGISDPFIVSRNGGFVALDMGVVSVDVDLFEHAAHAVLATDDDTRAVELAHEALKLYGGDLVETPYDTLGAAETRRQELRSLYVDIAVVGSSAAMRENMPQLAVRFARCAYDAAGLREDAAIALMDALKATGRTMDAREVYREYARNLLEATGMPPSTAMRGIASGLFPNLRGGLNGRMGRPTEDTTTTC